MTRRGAAGLPDRRAGRVGWPAAGLVCVLMLAACTGGSDPKGAPHLSGAATASAPFTITYAQEQELSSYNNNTYAEHAVRNSVALNQVLRGFSFLNPAGTAQPDTEFGTFTKVSDRPLTVRYTVDERAVWSDGTPIDCADFVLTWAANSGRWPSGRRDIDTGEALTLFEPAGNAGYDLARMPRCKAGDRGFTLVYRKPFADWQALFGNGEIMPAHVLEQRTGVHDLIGAVARNDRHRLKKIADFWNTGWVFRPGHIDTRLTPSAGPYRLTSWKAGQSLTLTRNPAWWGRPGKAATVVIRTIPQDQQAQALRNGEIQAMDPQPNPDLLGQLQRAGPSVTVSSYDTFTWEHLDFNFRGPFRNRALRTAFARCVPRQLIVDNLVKPQNPRAQVLQSRFLLPFQPGYAQVAGSGGASSASSSGGQAYTAVDVAGARRILQAEHRLGQRVVIRYQTPNPRRADEVDLIRDSCAKAGFRVRDGGSATFFGGELSTGDFDLALFAYQGSALVTQNHGVYDIGGGSNVGKYANRQVTGWLHRLDTELDPARQLQLEANLDRQLWADVATIPLFAFPGVLAVADGVTGVVFNPSQNGLTWNLQDWDLKR